MFSVVALNFYFYSLFKEHTRFLLAQTTSFVFLFLIHKFVLSFIDTINIKLQRE